MSKKNQDEFIISQEVWYFYVINPRFMSSGGINNCVYPVKLIKDISYDDENVYEYLTEDDKWGTASSEDLFESRTDAIKEFNNRLDKCIEKELDLIDNNIESLLDYALKANYNNHFKKMVINKKLEIIKIMQ